VSASATPVSPALPAASAMASHWPEYAIEATLLGIFMLCACLFTVLLFHPASPVPAAGRPNDLVHWQTTVLVPDIDAAAAAVRRGHFRLLTPVPVELPDTSLGFTRGLLVRDPDGHAVQLVEHQGVAHAQQ
jgi:hypothetical protein